MYIYIYVHEHACIYNHIHIFWDCSDNLQPHQSRNGSAISNPAIVNEDFPNATWLRWHFPMVSGWIPSSRHTTDFPPKDGLVKECPENALYSSWWKTWKFEDVWNIFLHHPRNRAFGLHVRYICRTICQNMWVSLGFAVNFKFKQSNLGFTLDIFFSQEAPLWILDGPLSPLLVWCSLIRCKFPWINSICIGENIYIITCSLFWADSRPASNSSTLPFLRSEFFKDIIAEGAVEYLECLGMHLSALLRMRRTCDR